MRLRSRKSKEENNTSPHFGRRLRTHTVGSRCDGGPNNLGMSTQELHVHNDPLWKDNTKESRIKAAKSCSDICDAKLHTKLNAKSSEAGSLWNIKTLGKPFSKLRRGKS